MAKLNTYGLKMTGIREASGDTKSLNGGAYPNLYLQISYNRRIGEILTNLHCGQNSWTVYRDPAIITVCHTSVPMTMQEIADAVKAAVDEVAQAEDIIRVFEEE